MGLDVSPDGGVLCCLLVGKRTGRIRTRLGIRHNERVQMFNGCLFSSVTRKSRTHMVPTVVF